MNKQLYDYTTKENIAPITNTEAVMTPSGQTAEQRNTEQMNAIKGVESIGDASVYPFLHVGNYTLEGANAKLNSLFQTTDSKYQGRLKLVVDEQTLWVEQYAINLAEGKWMQVAYGPFTVASDNRSLVRENTKIHISYRKNDGSADVLWKDFSATGVSLKTINGQSIVGEGNIDITAQGMIVLDAALDSTSENGVQNKVICNAINLVKNRISTLERKEAMLPFKDVLNLGFSPECQPGGFDGSGGSIVYDPIEKRFLISIDSDTYFSAWSAMGDRASSNDYDPQKGFYYTTIRDAQENENHSLRIYHWSKQKGNLVSTDEWIDRYFSAVMCPQYWGDEYPGDGVLGNYWYNPTTNILYQYRETKDGKVWEQVETLQRILCNPNTSELIIQVPGEDSYRILTEKDLDNIEGKSEVILVKHWEGAGPTEWTVGDYALDDEVLKVCTAVTGDVPTLEVVDAAGKVLILCNDINRKLYQYVDGDTPEQIVLIQDLKSIKSIVTPKYWGDTPGDAKVNWSKGDYWLDTSSNKLRVCTMAGSGSEALFDEANLGRIFVRDSAGKLYDMDNSTGIGPRLLNENDLSDINTKINKLPGEKAYPFEGIVNSILGYEAGLPTKVGKVVYVKKSSKGNPLNKFLLAVEVSTTPKSFMYYSKWNANHTALGLDSSIYANVRKDLWYTVDSSRLIIYHWSSSDNGLVPTGGGTSEVSVKAEGNTLTINNSPINFATVNGQPVLNGSAIVIEGKETEALPINNPSYLEYYLTPEQKANIKYAPDYHLWPIVWYGGTVNVAAENLLESYTGYVFAPTEYIFLKHGLDSNTGINKDYPNAMFNNKITVDNVKYNEVTGNFVLEEVIENDVKRYYKSWDNSNLYNQNDKPISHQIYVKYIRQDDSGVFYKKGKDGKPYRPLDVPSMFNGKRPESKYWDGGWKDLFTDITDFSSALTAWLASGVKDLKLLPGKLYYLDNTEAATESFCFLKNRTYFTIDGCGGGFFVRNERIGDIEGTTSLELFRLENCSFATIKNLTVASLRDNFIGGPSQYKLVTDHYEWSEPKMSVAGSNVTFLRISRWCNDITVENIKTFGVDQDFFIKANISSYVSTINTNITLKNIKSTLANGNVIRDVDGLLIDNYDFLWDGYSMGGAHIIYFQAIIGSVVIRNSKFRAAAPFRQDMFSHHSDGLGSDNSLQSLVFSGCEFTGVRILSAPYLNQKVRLENCVIRVTQRYYPNTGATSSPYIYKDAPITMQPRSIVELVNTTVITPYRFCDMYGTENSWNFRKSRLVIERCTFVRSRDIKGNVDSTSTFFGEPSKPYRGEYILKDTQMLMEYPGEDSKQYDSPRRVLGKEFEDLLGLSQGINKTPETALEGLSKREYPTYWDDPKVDCRITNEENTSLYKCTVIGSCPMLVLTNYNTYNGTSLVGQTINGPLILKFSENETYTLLASNRSWELTDGAETFWANIRARLIALGFTEAENIPLSGRREPRVFMRKTVSNNPYILITSKVAGQPLSYALANNVFIPNYVYPLALDSAIYPSKEGYAPTYEEMPEGYGLISNMQKISNKVEANSTIIYGENAGLPTTEPLNPTVGDKYTDGKNIYECVQEGGYPLISLAIYGNSSSGTSTIVGRSLSGPKYLVFSEKESYEIIPSGETLYLNEPAEEGGSSAAVVNRNKLRNYIIDKLINTYGFQQVNSIDRTNPRLRHPKQICLYDNLYTHITPANVGTAGYCVNNITNKWISNICFIYSIGTSTQASKEGALPQWESTEITEGGLVARTKALEEATGTMFSAYVSQAPQEPIAEGTYWFEFNQGSQSEGQLKKYTSDGWENVSGTRILYDAGDGQTSQSLYLCINGTSIKRITLTNV